MEDQSIKLKKKDLLKFGSLFLVVVALFLLLSLVFNKPNQQLESATDNQIIVNADGKQIINLTANFSGYQPSVIEAKAEVPAILKVTSNNNFGCGSAFVIPKLNVSKNLPANGTTEIEIKEQKTGTIIEAMCSMGMYRTQIKFI